MFFTRSLLKKSPERTTCELFDLDVEDKETNHPAHGEDDMFKENVERRRNYIIFRF